MEIFLNLVWLGLSLAFTAWWVAAVRNRRSDLRWSTVVAVALLLLLLFPVISITDDLVAMSAPAETEHALRRGDSPLLHAVPLLLDGGFALLGLALISLVCSLIAVARIRPFSFAARLRAGFLRASGVRPPPESFCLAV